MTYGIGKFYDATKRASMFIGGLSALTAINAATFSTGTLDATCTPIIGLWNPTTSGVNAVIQRATLGITITAATNTGPGPFVWAFGLAQTLTNGSAVVPKNALTLSASNPAAPKCLDYSGLALTGLSGTLTKLFGSGLGGGSAQNFSFVGTAVGDQTIATPAVELFDGSLIIPPGGVLGLFGTTQAVAHSAVSGLFWTEQLA